jgi:hypothetical protein
MRKGSRVSTPAVIHNPVVQEAMLVVNRYIETEEKKGSEGANKTLLHSNG